MKLSELDEMDVVDILRQLDLPPGFLAEYQKWCESRIRTKPILDLTFGKNPLLTLMASLNDLSPAKQFPAPEPGKSDE